MNLLNRIVVLLLLLAVGGVAIAVAVLAWTIPGDSIDALRETADWLEDHDGDTEKAILSVIAVAIAVLCLLVLVLELIPRRTNEVRVQDLKAGEATVSTAAIAGRVEEAVRQTPNVADAKVYVRARGKAVDVSMDLHVDADANLAEVTDAAADSVRDVLLNRMHVALRSQPQVRLHYRELVLRRPAAPAPVAAPVPAENIAATDAEVQDPAPTPLPEPDAAAADPTLSPAQPESEGAGEPQEPGSERISS